MRLVMKFGGTSVGNPECVAQAAGIVQAAVARGDQVLVVLSAMSGVTNALLASAREAAAGNVERLSSTRQELSQRHQAVIEQHVSTDSARAPLRELTERALDGFENLCRSIFVLGELTPRASDAVASLGERLIVPIAAQVLRDLGLNARAVDATRLIVTDDAFGAASPLMDLTCEKTRTQLLPWLQDRAVPVTTGF